MKRKREKSNFRLVQFKWIFLVDTMVIIGSVLSFGAIAAYGLDMQEENAILMLCMIPPMILTTVASTYVILHFIRRRMDELLDGIRAVGNGDMDVRLEPKGGGRIQGDLQKF